MNPSPPIQLPLLRLALVILGATTLLSAQTPDTPHPGSPEREVIGDANQVVPSFNSSTPPHDPKASFIPSEDGLKPITTFLCSDTPQANNAKSPAQPRVFPPCWRTRQSADAHLRSGERARAASILELSRAAVPDTTTRSSHRPAGDESNPID